MKLPDVVTKLNRDGLVNRVNDGEAETIRQHRQLKNLLRRHPNGQRDTYLRDYDAMMRIAEIALLSEGCELSEMPHRALRVMVDSLCGTTEVERVVAVRHAVKKSGEVPTSDDMSALLEVRRRLAERTGLAGLLDG